MALLDLLGRRWLLRVVWELRAGPLTFRALRAACADVSPTVLNDRLRELRETRFVVSTDEGYALSPLGRELLRDLAPVARFAERWARSLET
jgi:DNA-binding HxlR family transcriptional regulator